MTETGAGKVASRPTVAVGGQALSQQVTASLRTTIVDTDTGGPDACRLVFDDPGRNLLSSNRFELAKELTVIAGRVGDDAGEAVFTGTIYALGFEHDDRGTFTTVTAYDLSYGLYAGVHTKGYQNVTDSDLASQIAGEVGLDAGEIPSTSVLHEHVSQINETYFEFLSRRAREVDCQLTITGKKLNFSPATAAQDAPDPGDNQSTNRLQLVPGTNLQRLNIRVSGAQQVKEVEVRGWDPASKQAVISTATAATRTASMTDTPASVAGKFGDPKRVAIGVPLMAQAECDAVAAAKAEHLGSASVHAEGVAFGDPRIVAGAAVSLGNTGGRFDGKVTVTRARHIWDQKGYRTTFVASGSNDRSLLGLVENGTASKGSPQQGGVVGAIVTNVADPDNLCRVKVRFPWLDDDYESDWARVLQLGAGNERGLQLLPEVEDEVLVAFEHGDTRRPFVLGGLYNGVDAPPLPDAVDSGAGAVNKRTWKSRSGHQITLDDTGGSETVTIKTGSEKVSIVLDGSANGITINCDGDVKVAAKGNAEIKAQGDVKLEATGNASIKGASLKFEASADVTIKGSVIKLN